MTISTTLHRLAQRCRHPEKGFGARPRTDHSARLCPAASDGVHLAVPFKDGDDGELVLRDGKPIALYGEVCRGKGNARLFLDMWKRAFELFVQHEGLKTGREIARLIESEMKGCLGLDQPQFKQRSLNTWSQFKQYGKLQTRRAGMFFNVLPAPVDADYGMVGQSFDIDQYFGKSLYCQEGPTPT